MSKNIGKNAKDASVIIPYQKKEILLQFRSNTKKIFYPLHWGCIGGAKEFGETPKETAVREFYEETNIKLNKKDIVFFSEFSFFLHPKKKRIKRYFYTYKIRNLKRFIKKIKVGEGKKMKFFNSKNFYKIKKVVPYDKFILDYFCKIKNY